jgi:hypothetical protein
MTTRRSVRALGVLTLVCGVAAGGAVVANASGSTDSAATSPTTSQAIAGPGRRTCRDTSLIFCEDFNGVPVGGASSLAWGIDSRKATLAVQSTLAGRDGWAHRGRALHIHSLDNGHAFAKVEDLALDGKPLFGRMRLKVDAFPTAPDWAHFTLVEATGTDSTEIVRPVGGQYAPTNARTMWGIGADEGPTGDWTDWSESAPTTANTWQCVEWRLDPQDNQVQTWFDGVDNPDLTASTDNHGGNEVPFKLPKITTVKIGWQLYQPGTTPEAFDVWIDDIALANERIGC